MSPSPRRPSLVRSVPGVLRWTRCVLRRARSVAGAAGGKVPLALGATVLLAVLAGGPALARHAPETANGEEWISLFNGKDLTGWTPKFAKYALGENPYDTVRVENGLLEIRYDKWPTFNGEFGHVFYKDPFAYYRLVAEYRFVGEQVKGGPAWAIRNNGLMLHSPAPSTMLKDQDFPISLETQLLGGLGDGKARSTANLCTPGTNVVMNGTFRTEHCINSTSKTYDGDQWVRVEVVVHGDERVQNIMDGQVVLEYSRPQIGGGNVAPFDPKVKVDGTPLTSGYISIQAETAPIDFRKIELLDLEGCMDPKASNFKRYAIKPKAGACRY